MSGNRVGRPRAQDITEDLLREAERVLAEAEDLGRKHAALASKFALDLALALETGASGGDGKRPGKTAAKPGRRGPPSGRPPAAPPAGAPPTPPPPPKPAGGDDFEP